LIFFISVVTPSPWWFQWGQCGWLYEKRGWHGQHGILVPRGWTRVRAKLVTLNGTPPASSAHTRIPTRWRPVPSHPLKLGPLKRNRRKKLGKRHHIGRIRCNMVRLWKVDNVARDVKNFFFFAKITNLSSSLNQSFSLLL
jgi:hypothetical protein